MIAATSTGAAWAVVLGTAAFVLLVLVALATLAMFGRIERRLDDLEIGLRADLGAALRELRQTRPEGYGEVAPGTPPRADS